MGISKILGAGVGIGVGTDVTTVIVGVSERVDVTTCVEVGVTTCVCSSSTHPVKKNSRCD